MHLIPPTIGPDTSSEGEKLVFELLAADTTHPEWTVLHSQDIAHHRRQAQGEADFIVVAPGLGVLVLEVKGCHALHRSGGLWYYGSDPEGDHRGPFRQASEAMHSIRERLARNRRGLEGVLWHSAACFPFLAFREASEEWHAWQVIDEARLGVRSLAACIAAVLEQARARATELRRGWFDPSSGAPTPAQCEEIVRVLRPDFEFYESPKARAQRCEEEIRHYTEEQFEALDNMRRMPRVVFDGPAGTGKTLLALEATRRAHAAGKTVLFLCFNRALGEWLADQARELSAGSPAVVVRTVHEHMRKLAGDKVAGSPEDGERYWDHALPEAAVERLVESWDALEGEERDGRAAPDSSTVARRFGIFDVLVIDEAQDVLGESILDVLDLSVRGGLKEGEWRIFGDFAWQAIYDDGASLERFCASHGGGCAVFTLDENCRNTPRVADLACRCGGIEPGYARVLRADDGVDPQMEFYRDGAQQKDLLLRALEQLREEKFTGPQVVVLSTHADHGAAAASLHEPPWSDRLQPLVDDQTHSSHLDDRSGKIRYCSIYRFKGLEARAVVLTDIEKLTRPIDRSLVYVGATRAKQRLIVLAHESLRGKLA